MRFVPGNAQHIGAREQQQDSMGFSDPADKAFLEHGGFLGVLADGMGGMALGDLASRTAVSKFLRSYMGKSIGESIPQALLRSLHEANEAVLALANDRGLREEMGTTLVAAVAEGRSLYWISAGDSRAYLIREGRVTQLTVDHVFANQLETDVASGRLSRTEALGHPERNDLTSYLGIAELSEIDRNIRQLPLDAGDKVILCSDGAYKNLSESEMAAACAGSPQEACEEVIAQVLAKHTPRQDNVTVLAIDCQPGPVAVSRRGAGLIWRNVPAAGAAMLVVLIACVGIWRWAQQADSGDRSPQTKESQRPQQQPNSSADPKGNAAGEQQNGNANRKQAGSRNSNQNSNAAPVAPGADPHKREGNGEKEGRGQDKQLPASGPAPQESASPTSSPEQRNQEQAAWKSDSLAGSAKRRIERAIGRAKRRTLA